jgi:hypothetical protein
MLNDDDFGGSDRLDIASAFVQDPITTTRLNLEASRRTPKKPLAQRNTPVRVDRIEGEMVYVSAGGGGSYPLQALSNGSLQRGQVLVAQINPGFGASATWMPQ